MLLQYIIKLTISLSLVYLFYQLLLRRLTFYNWNRWYLLVYSAVCFVIPMVNVFTIIVERPALRESAFVNSIPAITQLGSDATVATTPAEGIDWWLVALVVFVTGGLVMIGRLLIQYYSLYKIRTKAVLLYGDKVKLYHIDAPVIPFSFGNGIYVNQHQHSEGELKDIIRHEFIHVKQRHSLDIIWSELLCVVNWYNPFAWLLRHDIRQNLEFIADRQVLQTGLDRKQYQYLLLKVVGVNSFSIANQFNFSSLKKRIAMMNKAKSARVHLMRFLFLLPLLLVVLLAFRNATQNLQQPEQPITTDTLPQNTKEFKAAWKEVKHLNVQTQQNNGQEQGTITIQLKNGATEQYDLAIPEQKLAFEKKYGAVPKPPVPPKAPREPRGAVPAASGKPAAPEKPEAPEQPEAREIADHAEMPEAVEAPEPPTAPEPPGIDKNVEAPAPPPAGTPMAAPAQEDCINPKGYCITVADNNGESIVIVKNKKDKIVEAVTLNEWLKNDRYTNRYGEIKPAPKPFKIVMGRPIGVRVAPLTAKLAEPVGVTSRVRTTFVVEPTAPVTVNVKPVTRVKVARSLKLPTPAVAPVPAKAPTPQPLPLDNEQ